jgi:hypothetical protein
MEGYDTQEPDPKVIVGFAAFLLVFVSLAGFGIRNYFVNVVDDEQHVKIAEAPTTDVNKLKADAQAELHSYGWVDQKAGTVHMPIERAMEMEIERAHQPVKTEAPAKVAEKPAAKKGAKKK